VIESRDAARRRRWEETASKMDMTDSSHKAYALTRHLGAAERPPRKPDPPVRANAVTTHLIQVAKAPPDKKFEHKVRNQWQYFLKHAEDKRLPPAFMLTEISEALNALFRTSPLLLSSRVLLPSMGMLVAYRRHRRATQLHHMHNHQDPALRTTAMHLFCQTLNHHYSGIKLQWIT